MEKTSKLMNVFLKLKLNSIAWSLRRLYCPVKKNDLVLEVGSGGNPYFRSNVLIDAYIDTRERHFEKLIFDRPTVLGFVENLPFKDNQFDYVIANNVLEHSWEPEKFIAEIQRVGKAGYIEVPDALFERLTGYYDHKLEITDRNNKLIIRKKENFIQDKDVFDLFKKVSKFFPKIIASNPFIFFVSYYWTRKNGGIKYKIVNPEYDFDWTPPKTQKVIRKPTSIGALKKWLLILIRKFLSQTRRNNKLNIMEFIMCPKCKSSEFNNYKEYIVCKNCNSKYEIVSNSIIKFN